ncbi:MAG: hypothetical protein H7039_24580 [Bryobacteraceae bacterium]|nr:hypothetical protein [Bryobacteraceae bacterium]
MPSGRLVVVSKLLGATAAIGGIYALPGFAGVKPTFDAILVGFWMLPMVWVAATVLILADNRLRCKTCACKLRMPVAEGNYGNLLRDRPSTEWVCPYGHGKLTIEVSISGFQRSRWQPFGNIWDELQLPTS